jgi:hypothetical protein
VLASHEIGDRYAVHAELGRGGMAKVYRVSVRSRHVTYDEAA